MLTDYQLRLADAQNMATVTSGTRTVSTNVIDLTKAGGSIPGNILQILVDTAFTSTGLYITFTIETHTTADFSSARTALWTSAAIAYTALTAGTVVVNFRLPANLKQYLAVTATPSGATVTAGKFDAMIVVDADIAAS